MTRPVKGLDLENGVVEMAHGSGGRAMAQLLDELFLPAFNNAWLEQRADSACLTVAAERMVMSCDSHVIVPLFFPGGDIGALSVHGTLNDVAMSGAVPRYLSASFILEEGFPLRDLKRIVDSMARAAREAGVAIVTGDTKVVERGKGDGVFITTTGIGELTEGCTLSAKNIRAGDRIIVSGDIGDHGVAVLSCRENLQFDTDIESDSASLHTLVADMLQAAPDVRCLRDPTRGGLATTLNELASQSAMGMRIEETAIPLKREVAAACELLGLDPLYMANEGKLVAFCPPEQCGQLLAAMRQHPLGKKAAVIGEVVRSDGPLVIMKSALGGQRIVDWLSADPLPRIC